MNTHDRYTALYAWPSALMPSFLVPFWGCPSWSPYGLECRTTEDCPSGGGSCLDDTCHCPDGQEYCCSEGGYDCSRQRRDCRPTEKCKDGEACGWSADCLSGVCYGGVCLAPTCTDATKNGDEQGEDCGGSCAPCAGG